jgi:hypothetical protein
MSLELYALVVFPLLIVGLSWGAYYITHPHRRSSAE